MFSGAEHAATVLLVDDDPVVRELFSACLQKAGHTVAVAGDGREAQSLFRDAPGSVRLLITDIQMPFVSGIELADFAASRGCRCPVLLISGSFPPAEAAGKGWGFLQKPFTTGAFLEKVTEMLSRVAREPKRADGTRPRVILAEDDAEMRQRLCRLLHKNYDVVAALDGGETVLQKAEEFHPELILLDIGMPGMNGFAVARLLRNAMPSVPVVFVTQHAEPGYVHEAFACGGAAYVLKRHIVKELGAALEQVRAGSRYLSPGLRAA